MWVNVMSADTGSETKRVKTNEEKIMVDNKRWYKTGALKMVHVKGVAPAQTVQGPEVDFHVLWLNTARTDVAGCLVEQRLERC